MNSVRLCYCLSVHSDGHIFLSIFATSGTEVMTLKSKNEFVGGQHCTAPSAIFRNSHVLPKIGVEDHNGDVIFQTGVKILHMRSEKYAIPETVSIAKTLQNWQHAQNP